MTLLQEKVFICYLTKTLYLTVVTKKLNGSDCEVIRTLFDFTLYPIQKIAFAKRNVHRSSLLKAHVHPNGFARLCFCFEMILLSNAVF